MGQRIDEAILFGTNKPASWRSDILATATAAGNVVTRASSNPDLYQDLLGENGVFAKVEADGFDVSGIMAAVSMKATLRGLVDSNKQPIFKEIGGMQNRSQYVIEGAPMDFPKNGAFDASKALLIAGDFRGSLSGTLRFPGAFSLFRGGTASAIAPVISPVRRRRVREKNCKHCKKDHYGGPE